MTRDQRVPVSDIGTSITWSRATAHRQFLVAGLDTQWVTGDDRELAFTSGQATANLNNGGSQLSTGIYGEDRIRLGQGWNISMGARIDHWVNSEGHQRTIPISAASPETSVLIPDRSQAAISPRIALHYSRSNVLQAYAFVGRSFRAPSLDELYRSFRVGSIVTEANPSLIAERLSGGEAGLNLRIKTYAIRGSYFYNIVTDPVSNVTLSSTPTLITNQRENLGRTRSQGTEVVVRSQVAESLTFDVAYQYARAVVLNAPESPGLVGLRVPQVPWHSATFQLRYATPRTLTVAAQGRYIGQQFDDDLNRLPLRGFFTADVFAAYPIKKHIQIYAAAENILNRRYQVARTPTLQVGPPVMLRAGVRFTFVPLP